MNIPDSVTTENTVQSSQGDTSTDSTRKKDKEKDKDTKSFSKVLAEKSAKPEDAAAGNVPQNSFRETAPVVQQPKSISSASLPPALQNLVQEITVATGPQNRSQVDIQLNSKTFDGLKISISHGQGNVSIQMLSQTSAVASVLNRNIDTLGQALAARGVPVESITVRTVGSSAASGRMGGQSKRSGRQP